MDGDAGPGVTPSESPVSGLPEPAPEAAPLDDFIVARPAYAGPEHNDSHTARRTLRFFIISAALVIAGFVLAGLFRGPVAEFMFAGLEILPFAFLAFLAYVGERRLWVLVVAAMWHIFLLWLLSSTPLLLTLALVITRAGPVRPGALPSLPSSSLWLLGGVWLWAALGFLVGCILLLPAVRRCAARVLPLDPGSWVHGFALSLVGGAAVIFFGQLAGSGGRPVFLALIQADPAFARSVADENIMMSMVYGLVWTIPGVLVAVGYPVARTVRECAERLGLVRPTLKQVLAAVLIAALLVGVQALLDPLFSSLWKFAGWPATDEDAVNKLFHSSATPLGAVVLGVTAGIGEELAIRGVLQPRMGIILSNLFFTSLHALQYGFDGLLSVFITGLALGFVRHRTNTSTSCIVHGTYDFTLLMMQALSHPFPQH